MNEIVIQAIGFVGLGCFFVSYQIKSNKALFVMQTLASICFCIQFVLLGALTGCLNQVVAIIRNIMLSKIDKWPFVRWTGWAVIFTIVCLVITIATWKGPISLLPFLAMASTMFGYWTNNAQKIRTSILFCAGPSWLIYNAIVGSIGGVINEIITIASILISVYRYGWKQMGDESNEMNK